jgi:ribosomal protein L11 methyltransferase
VSKICSGEGADGFAQRADGFADRAAAALKVLFAALDITPADRSATLQGRDLIYAALDDHSPTALEDRDDGVRAFFRTSAARDEAARTLGARFHTTAIDVDDEDWARRSQAGFPPVTVGRITIHESPTTTNPESRIPNPDAIHLAIPPSMAFGTGHHATTRLCLAALQQLELQGKTVLDVGTGSGVLAIAAARLGAASALGIDVDPDAIQLARENVTLNPAAANVAFAIADLADAALTPADVILANLTGALLVRSAPLLTAALVPSGVLIVSGLLTSERDDVRGAFSGMTIVSEQSEDEWSALVVKKP